MRARPDWENHDISFPAIFKIWTCDFTVRTLLWRMKPGARSVVRLSIICRAPHCGEMLRQWLLPTPLLPPPRLPPDAVQLAATARRGPKDRVDAGTLRLGDCCSWRRISAGLLAYLRNEESSVRRDSVQARHGDRAAADPPAPDREPASNWHAGAQIATAIDAERRFVVAGARLDGARPEVIHIAWLDRQCARARRLRFAGTARRHPSAGPDTQTNCRARGRGDQQRPRCALFASSSTGATTIRAALLARTTVARSRRRRADRHQRPVSRRRDGAGVSVEHCCATSCRTDVARASASRCSTDASVHAGARRRARPRHPQDAIVHDVPMSPAAQRRGAAGLGIPPAGAADRATRCSGWCRRRC